MKTIESQPPKLKYIYIYIYALWNPWFSLGSLHISSLWSLVLCLISRRWTGSEATLFFHPCYSPVLLVQPEWTKTYTYFGGGWTHLHTSDCAESQGTMTSNKAINETSQLRSWNIDYWLQRRLVYIYPLEISWPNMADSLNHQKNGGRLV